MPTILGSTVNVQGETCVHERELTLDDDCLCSIEEATSNRINDGEVIEVVRLCISGQKRDLLVLVVFSIVADTRIANGHQKVMALL
jgi:hypothetical protein